MERISDSDGKRFMVREFKRDDIVDYKRYLLTVGACESFLPVHFIDSDAGMTAFYRIDEFVSLEESLSRQEWLNEGPGALLCNIFSMILRRLIEAEDLLLDLDDLILDVNSVYIHAKQRHVKLAYQSRAGVQDALQKSFLALLKATTAIVNDEQWNVYSEEIYRQATEENLGLSGILRRTIEQSRHILERKWPEREHFRAGLP